MTDSFLIASQAQADSMTDRSSGKAARAKYRREFFIRPPWSGLAEAVTAPPADPADADLASCLARRTEQQSRVPALLVEDLLNMQARREGSCHGDLREAEDKEPGAGGMLLRSLDLSELARVERANVTASRCNCGFREMP